MAAPFVPLTTGNCHAAPAAPAQSAPAAVAPGSGTSAFEPLKQVVPADVATASADPADRPTVTVQRQNGEITHIRIQCRCGEVIELDCVY